MTEIAGIAVLRFFHFPLHFAVLLFVVLNPFIKLVYQVFMMFEKLVSIALFILPFTHFFALLSYRSKRTEL